MIVIFYFCFQIPRYLVQVMLFTFPLLIPNIGDTIHDINGWGSNYKYARGYTNVNPLYVRGCLRKKKRSSKLASVKGFFVCQIIAIVIVILAWIYLGVRYIYGEIILVEKILANSCILLIFIWEGLKLYYQKCCDWSYQYTENADGIWMPFCFLYQIHTGSLYHNSFFCRYHVPYGEMKKRFVQKAGEMGYAPSKCYKTDNVKRFLFLTRRNGGRLDIAALIHVKQMKEESWDVFNNIFETFWREVIADRYEKRKMAFTFLICVDENSEELEKIKKQMYAQVDSKTEKYRLSALLDYSDQDRLYIASDFERNGNNKRCRQIRKELLSMLGISTKFNGKEYPERNEEKEVS